MNEISDKVKREIASEAKRILHDFNKALLKVNFKKRDTKKETGGFRDEKDGVQCADDFRERMFENAPMKNKDFIIMEKKRW